MAGPPLDALSLELYAVDVDVDDLSKAVEVAEEYAETVLFGYDASNARATIRRMTPTPATGSRSGRSNRPDFGGSRSAAEPLSAPLQDLFAVARIAGSLSNH